MESNLDNPSLGEIPALAPLGLEEIQAMDDESLLETVREVIRLEAAALSHLVDTLDESFAKALKIIASCRGKVIVTGVGKSGLIARKIAATMSSTGTVATFLHPADGMHGDLGMVTNEDVVIALGKSGESEELVALIAPLRRIGAKIVAITAVAHSKLAKGADITLLTPVEREACPLNLAPTVSTTMALAVGDALAVGLMKMKNFRPEDFAKYHPGGKLGKRLLLKVSDLMIPLDKCPVLDPQTAVMEDVLMALTEFGLGLVLFLDGGRMAGILTDGDIRRLLQQRRQELFNLKVSDLINRAPLTVSPDLKAVDALGFMENRQRPLNVVLVSEGTRVLGVVRLHELVAVS